MKDRVVITGLGIAAPNGVGLSAFTDSLKKADQASVFLKNSVT